MQPKRVQLPSNLIRIPNTRQSTNWTCGVVALQSILRYYGPDLEIREDNLVKELKAGPEHGTQYPEIIRYAKEKGFSVQEKQGLTVEDLKKEIDGDNPVLVCYQAWGETETENFDYTNDWEDGHYSVVVGYDNERLFFMDPSTLGCYAYIPYADFEKRWHDCDGKDGSIKLVHWGLIFHKDRAEENLYSTASYLG